jgi:hypothetical protein
VPAAAALTATCVALEIGRGVGYMAWCLLDGRVQQQKKVMGEEGGREGGRARSVSGSMLQKGVYLYLGLVMHRTLFR